MTTDKITKTAAVEFPSPLEVDRWIYKMQYITIDELVTFPAPLEVDKYLYELWKKL